jgi:hypothetical protein
MDAPAVPSDPIPASSWMHGLVVRVEGLPAPTWAVLLGVFALSALLMHLLPWTKGSVPFGEFDPASAVWGALLPVLLWISADLERVAARAFDAFRPALTLPPDAAERLRTDLIVVPARPALVVTAIALLANVGSFATDPVTYTINVPPLVVAFVFLYQALIISLMFEILYRLIRQSRLIRRTLDEDVAIDVFRPHALHAFATLAARPGILLCIMVAASVPVTPPPDSVGAFLVGVAPFIFVPPMVAVAAFVLPLAGAHERLAGQKAMLQDAAELRLQATLANLNRDVDAGEVGRADGLNKTIASLVAQREILARLPTWPWSAGTVRGLGSAILLPLMIFLAQQALGRLF